MPQAHDDRRRDLAMIHVAIKQLGLDRTTYENMLWTVARVRSAADLDDAGRRAVIEHLKARGFKVRGKGRSTPATDKEKLIAKIRAQLGAADRVDAYADGMARKMFHVDRFEWCDPEQLRKIVTALTYDARRRAAKL